MTIITPIERYDDIWVKRDDRAFADPDGACGAKVRQFMAMLAAQPGNAPLVVGCSAVSCQQVYIGDATRRTGRPGHVVIPRRKVWSAATKWTHDQGVQIVEVPPPAWRTVYMKEARALAKTLHAVRWDPGLAVDDTITQCANIPDGVKRIVVPTGSGLVAAGCLAGVYLSGLTIPVLAVAVSTLADPGGIRRAANEAIARAGWGPGGLNLQFIKLDVPYERVAWDCLPDGTQLDPYYAAKVWPYRQPGDLFWVTGCRPRAAMPPAGSA